MSTEERLLRLENAFNTLVELAQNHDAQFDELRATMNSLGERVTVLVDAQIRTEEKAQRTDEALRQLADAQRELAVSQRLTDERLNMLIDILTKGRGGNGGGSGEA